MKKRKPARKVKRVKRTKKKSLPRVKSRRKPRKPRIKAKPRRPRKRQRPPKKPVPKRRKRIPKAKRKRANLKRRIRRDKVRVFGERRRRQPKEMPKAIVQPDLGEVPFEEQLQQEQEKPEGAFAWTNEDEFIQQMELLGFSEREAY